VRERERDKGQKLKTQSSTAGQPLGNRWVSRKARLPLPTFHRYVLEESRLQNESESERVECKAA